MTSGRREGEGETPKEKKAIASNFYENKSARTRTLSFPLGDIFLRRIKGLGFNGTFVVVGIISTVGFASTLMLITTDINSSFFDVYASIIQYLPSKDEQTGSDEQVTLIGPRPWGIHYFWISKYIFDRDLLILEERYAHKIQTDDFITISDNRDDINEDTNEKHVAKFKGNDKDYPGYRYPYSNMRFNVERGFDVWANY